MSQTSIDETVNETSLSVVGKHGVPKRKLELAKQYLQTRYFQYKGEVCLPIHAEVGKNQTTVFYQSGRIEGYTIFNNSVFTDKRYKT